MTAYGDILWTPDAGRIARSRMLDFMRRVDVQGQAVSSYEELHRWSLAAPAEFWAAVAEHAGLSWQTAPKRVFVPPPPGKMRGAIWFEGSRLNYAENLLAPGAPDEVAVVAHAEGAPRRVVTRGELRALVARAQAGLEAAGVRAGDRVAGVTVNGLEALVAMLATAATGAIWSSCSPDFGQGAIVDRLSQVEPKVVFFSAAYRYGGKRCDVAPAMGEALARLPSVRRAVVISHLEGEEPVAPAPLVLWRDFLGAATVPRFEPLAFDAPLFIMFSSGTTGVPKCITHGVGGTLLQHVKELGLHADLGPGSRLLYYTTCGWMMWNWMASALATGASLVVYDGAVTYPDLGVLWRVVREEGVTAFGTSPKFLSACMAHGTDAKGALAGYRPATILATGSPLLPEHAAWVYAEVGDVHLASISGGTDIISCFMLGVPLLPVRAGEIQAAGLGMAVDAWDEAGLPVRGGKGELVCTAPFPSMPVGFWNDPGGVKYTDAYFGFYAALGREVWRHGDFVEITPHQGVVVYGRSDATLNPGGVRIGTAELYRQVEAMEEVADSLAIGRVEGDDTVIVLFVKLKAGWALDAALTRKIKDKVRLNLTPRHVPKEIVAVKDVPYTRSGKKVELAVTEAVHGLPVKNLAALANPEAMEEYVAMAPKAT